MRLQMEFNKPVLAHMSYSEAGSFGVAQRIMDVVALPLVALQEALWPRVYAAGETTARLRYTGVLLLLFAMAAGVALVLMAELLPWLIGADYQGAADVLRWLAFLPAAQVARGIGNAWLIAKGYTRGLTATYLIAAVTGVVLALAWIPRYSITGAAAALYGSAAAALGVQAWLIVCRRRV